MKRLLLAILILSVPGLALAQPPIDDTTTDPPPPPPPPPDPDPPPTTTTSTAIAPVDEPEPEPGPAMRAARPMRPEAYSIAVGLGWDFPADIQAPDVTSVRVRHPSGLTAEPMLEFSRATQSVDDGMPPDIEVTSATMQFSLLGRLPVIQNGRVDLELAGGLGYSRTNTDPDGPDNDTTTTGFGISYGLAVCYWFSPHLQLSATGMNPIFATATEIDEMGPGMETETKTSSFGLVFEPNVFVMLHLYN
jgi:hypothetical protein